MLLPSNAMRPSKKSPCNGSSIVLTGASGSLGRALAVHHAKAGVALRLWGRDRARLGATAQAASALGSTVRETCFDLIDAHGAAQLVLEQDRTELFDAAYLVAGTGETRKPGAVVEDPELVVHAACLNFAAPAAMAAALAGQMAQRGHGRIVLMGSAAGHHSLPFAAGYSGSKAGLARFSDALRLAVKPYGVSVTLAAPGFIDTPAARANSADLPFAMPVEEAARRIAHAGERRARHYVTPWPFRIVRALDPVLPVFLRDRLLARLEP